MEKISFIATVLFSFTVLSAPPKVVKEFTGKVANVIDGDSVEITVGQNTVILRLEGIDAPEPAQNFGKKAKEILSALVLDKTVSVKQTGDDRYGRIIGYLFLDKTDINSKMVEDGWAWHFSKYNDEERLAKLEQAARKNKKGLWADTQTPVAPWDHRAKKKTPEIKMPDSKEK